MPTTPRLLAFALAGLLTYAAPSFAIFELTVNSFADKPDNSPGDDFCDAAPTGEPPECTLRAAIQEACAQDAETINYTTIHLPAGTYELTLAGAGEDAGETGDLDIFTASETTTVWVNVIGPANGPKPVIDAAGLDRVFDVQRYAYAALVNVVVTGGVIDGSGGGIRNQGYFALVNANVIGNLAEGGDGGGVYSTDFFAAESSTIAGNRCLGSPAFPCHGGGYFGSQSTDFKSSTVSGNEADYGGGIAYRDGLSLLTTTIAENRARWNASAIYLTATATQSGVNQCTIAENVVDGASPDGDGQAVLAPLDLSNTILANNHFGSSDVPADCGSAITLHGYDVLGPVAAACTVLYDNAAVGDLVGVDPRLGPLGSFGGPTETMLPRPDSPAVDIGPTFCSGNGLDQRGFVRLFAYSGDVARCDAGSVELQDLLHDGFESGDLSAWSAKVP